jgi:gliding motility-associated-like protein
MLQSGTYQVNMTDANGCKTDTSITVGLYPTPTVAVAQTPESCKSKNGTIALTVNSAAPSSVKYTWDGLNNTTPVLHGISAGSYNVIIQDTLCAIDTTIIIETIDSLIANFTIQSYDTCMRTATFVNTSFVENGTIASVVWKIPALNITSSDSLFTYTFPDPPTSQNVDYIIRLTAITPNGCTDSIEQTISIYPSPKIKIDGKGLICEYDSVYLKAVSIRSEFVKHVWNWQDSNNINITTTTIDEEFKIYGKGVYSLISFSTKNCPATDAITVIEVPTPRIEVTSNIWETCAKENGSIQITAENALEPVKFIWNTGRPQDTTNRVDNVAAGKYFVRIIDGNGCFADTDIIVDSYSLPFIADAVKINEKCDKENGEIRLTINSDAPNSLIYYWEGYNENNTNVLTGLKAGTYKVSIHDSLCVIDTVLTITHEDGPVADFEINSYSVMVNHPFIVTDLSSGSVKIWNWDMGDGNNLTGKVIIHSYYESGDYKILLEIIDENGCIDTTSKIIHIFKLHVYIPNIFTPNGDGINDIWKPVMSEYSKEGYQLSVFDRWGQVIFHTTDTEEGWDGTINGHPVAPNTVYSYKLKVKDYIGKEHKFAGHITLVR